MWLQAIAPFDWCKEQGKLRYLSPCQASVRHHRCKRIQSSPRLPFRFLVGRPHFLSWPAFLAFFHLPHLHQVQPWYLSLIRIRFTRCICCYKTLIELMLSWASPFKLPLNRSPGPDIALPIANQSFIYRALVPAYSRPAVLCCLSRSLISW